MTNNLNPFRKLLLEHKPPLNSRALKYPSPICCRIIKNFQDLPLSYKDIGTIPHASRNITFPPYSCSSLHTQGKHVIKDSIWKGLFHNLLTNYSNHSCIYIDGSVKEDKSGCGVWSSNFSLKVRLPDNTSIFTCELYAIALAIEHASKLPGKFIILSDSLSSVQALASPHKSKHNLVLKIATNLLNLESNKIIIEWIPCHVGIEGNS